MPGSQLFGRRVIDGPTIFRTIFRLRRHGRWIRATAHVFTLFSSIMRFRHGHLEVGRTKAVRRLHREYQKYTFSHLYM